MLSEGLNYEPDDSKISNDHDCIVGKSCEKWTIDGFEEKANFDPNELYGEDRFSPVLDHGWHGKIFIIK